MNDSDDLLPDELIEEALASFRSVTPPDELHQANLVAVDRALARRTEPTWWRRSVPVPVPVALAASLAFVFITAALLKTLVASAETQQHSPGQIQANVIVDDADTHFVGEDEPDPTWSVTWSHIHSLGLIANSKAPDDAEAEEIRDDS